MSPELRLDERIAQLELAARADPGGRGLASAAAAGLLKPAAAALAGAGRVLLVTGFCVRRAMIGETDGPPGAASLAAALTGLGKSVAVLSDRWSIALVEAALRAHGLRTALGNPAAGSPAAGVPAAASAGSDPGLPTAGGLTATTGMAETPTPTVLVYAFEDEAGALAAAAAFGPDLALAIERPGSAPDGSRYSMRGIALDELVPAADALFGPADGERTWVTVAVGDGGNELGMGGLRDACAPAIAQGALVFCAAAADYPVVAGVSNWGAYALAAATALIKGGREAARTVLPPPQAERAALSAVTAAGGVDGVSGLPADGVDGLSAAAYFAPIEAMYALATEDL
jgi:hypothetical protein